MLSINKLIYDAAQEAFDDCCLISYSNYQSTSYTIEKFLTYFLEIYKDFDNKKEKL